MIRYDMEGDRYSGYSMEERGGGDFLNVEDFLECLQKRIDEMRKAASEISLPSNSFNSINYHSLVNRADEIQKLVDEIKCS
jgi:archaellum component FlaC